MEVLWEGRGGKEWATLALYSKTGSWESGFEQEVRK